jgi:hypothetical protein
VDHFESTCNQEHILALKQSANTEAIKNNILKKQKQKLTTFTTTHPSITFSKHFISIDKSIKAIRRKKKQLTINIYCKFFHSPLQFLCAHRNCRILVTTEYICNEENDEDDDDTQQMLLLLRNITSMATCSAAGPKTAQAKSFSIPRASGAFRLACSFCQVDIFSIDVTEKNVTKLVACTACCLLLLLLLLALVTNETN